MHHGWEQQQGPKLDLPPVGGGEDGDDDADDDCGDPPLPAAAAVVGAEYRDSAGMNHNRKAEARAAVVGDEDGGAPHEDPVRRSRTVH